MRSDPSSLPASITAPVVQVSLADGQCCRGLLDSIGAGVVCFTFLRAEEPALEVGGSCILSVTSKLLGSSLELGGEVLERAEDRRTVRYLLGVGEDELTGLSILIERRAHQRVPAGTTLGCILFSSDGWQRFEGRIEDVSATGMRVFIPLEEAAGLAEQASVNICAQLPDDPSLLEVVGIVRNHNVTTQGHVLGLEFVVRSAREYETLRARVGCFVRERQAQLLVEDDSGQASARRAG